MIFFQGNYLNSAKLKNPVTIIHYFDKKTLIGLCSCHEVDHIEKALQHKIGFKPYSVRGYVQYYKPTEEEVELVRTIDLTFCRRKIERVEENGGILFNKLEK